MIKKQESAYLNGTRFFNTKKNGAIYSPICKNFIRDTSNIPARLSEAINIAAKVNNDLGSYFLSIVMFFNILKCLYVSWIELMDYKYKTK